MGCPGCIGFLSRDTSYTDQGRVDVLRSLGCGGVFDELILSNRRKGWSGSLDAFTVCPYGENIETSDLLNS